VQNWVADKYSLKDLELPVELQVFRFLNLLEIVVLANDKKESLKDSAMLTEFIHRVVLVVVELLKVGRTFL
jgi:hypothetical protein